MVHDVNADHKRIENSEKKLDEEAQQVAALVGRASGICPRVETSRTVEEVTAEREVCAAVHKGGAAAPTCQSPPTGIRLVARRPWVNREVLCCCNLS